MENFGSLKYMKNEMLVPHDKKCRQLAHPLVWGRATGFGCYEAHLARLHVCTVTRS